MSSRTKIPRHENMDVTVMGAGLTGSCVALELASRGFSVALVDQDRFPMNRASRRNEGKIHLGLIYAADASFATSDLQLRGALSFSQLLTRWLGDAAGRWRLSTPFAYLVAQDSLIGPEDLEAHYTMVEDAYHRHLKETPSLSYLGARPERLAWRLSSEELDGRLNRNMLSAAFGTNELAVDTDQLADLVTAAITAAPRINFWSGYKVREIDRKSGHFKVSGDGPDGYWTLRSEQVVNATWENRIGLDAALGIEHRPGWLYRLKYRVLARLPRVLYGAPSATMVLGPYGDVVIRPDGTAYLSWYPAGLRGWSNELRPPDQWEKACRGESSNEAPELVEAIIAGIEPWYPDIVRCNPFQVDAGAIVAYGHTDVDDRHSGLHDRTRVGVVSFDGYHSVDPGKLTTAPLFAMEAAEKVAADSQRLPIRSGS